jgi:hypothetical protein
MREEERERETGIKNERGKERQCLRMRYRERQ